MCHEGRGLAVSEKKTMNLCACESEEHEHGVGADVNSIIMSDVLY